MTTDVSTCSVRSITASRSFQPSGRGPPRAPRCSSPRTARIPRQIHVVRHRFRRDGSADTHVLAHGGPRILEDLPRQGFSRPDLPALLGEAGHDARLPSLFGAEHPATDLDLSIRHAHPRHSPFATLGDADRHPSSIATPAKHPKDINRLVEGGKELPPVVIGPRGSTVIDVATSGAAQGVERSFTLHRKQLATASSKHSTSDGLPSIR